MTPPVKHLVTVDAIIIDGTRIALIQRKNPPFEGMWALPGGFVDENEEVESACLREAKEETGLNIYVRKLIGIYSRPNRDPRGHIISIAYYCERKCGALEAGDDAKNAKWFNLDNLPPLAFDHKTIIEDCFNR
jgi:8-oxo-dGTP diphosphatase